MFSDINSIINKIRKQRFLEKKKNTGSGRLVAAYKEKQAKKKAPKKILSELDVDLESDDDYQDSKLVVLGESQCEEDYFFHYRMVRNYCLTFPYFIFMYYILK